MLIVYWLITFQTLSSKLNIDIFSIFFFKYSNYTKHPTMGNAFVVNSAMGIHFIIIIFYVHPTMDYHILHIPVIPPPMYTFWCHSQPKYWTQYTNPFDNKYIRKKLIYMRSDNNNNISPGFKVIKCCPYKVIQALTMLIRPNDGHVYSRAHNAITWWVRWYFRQKGAPGGRKGGGFWSHNYDPISCLIKHEENYERKPLRSLFESLGRLNNNYVSE